MLSVSQWSTVPLFRCSAVVTLLVFTHHFGMSRIFVWLNNCKSSNIIGFYLPFFDVPRMTSQWQKIFFQDFLFLSTILSIVFDFCVNFKFQFNVQDKKLQKLEHLCIYFWKVFLRVYTHSQSRLKNNKGICKPGTHYSIIFGIGNPCIRAQKSAIPLLIILVCHTIVKVSNHTPSPLNWSPNSITWLETV